MAKKTNLTGAALFRETSVDQWHSLLQEYEKHNIEIQYDKEQIKLTCLHPDHNDSTPSAYLNCRFGNYHCWSCHNETVFDPIKVVSIIADCDYGEAFAIFVEHFELRPARKDAELAFTRSQEDKKLMKDIVAFTRFCLREVYNSPTQFSSSYKKAVKWLHTRKIDGDDLDLFSIGILVGGDTLTTLSTKWFFQEKRPLADAAAFLESYKLYFGKVNTPSNYGALLFPHFTTPDQVGRIQIRVDFLSNIKSNLKFFFVTPGDKAPEHIERLFENETGFFGLDTWGRTSGKSGGFAVAATEGATDTIAACKAQIEQFGHMTLPTIAVPGQGAKNIDRLVSFGIQEVRFIGDHPTEHGDEVVGNYLSQSRMLDIMPFRWPQDINAKDVAKLYLDKGAETVCGMILDNSNYELAHEHVLRLLRADIDREGAGPERLNKLLEERMKGIGSSAAQRALVAAASKEFAGISEKALETTIGIDDDNLDGFKLRIRRDIESYFKFFYKEVCPEDQKIMVALEQVATGKKFLFTANSTNHLVDTICEPFGARTDWAQQCRMPDNLRFKKVGKKRVPLSPSNIRREMTVCVREALESIISEMEYKYDAFDGLANGIHQINHDGEEKIMLVNGDSRYMGVFVEDPLPRIQWSTYFPEKVIESARRRPRWTENIKSEDDLWEGNKVDMKQLWKDIYNTIDAGWAFKNQEADVTWLTGLAIYSAIYDFSNRTLLTVVTGEKESGKSRLVKEFFGGKRPLGSRMPCSEFYNYLEFPSTSEAGIRQEYAGVSGVQRRGLILDEFENDGVRSKEKMAAIFGTLRGMLDGNSLVKKGTKGGRSITYNLRFPTLLAGIMEFKDPTGAVESRVYRVETKREPGRTSPMRSVAAAHPHIDGDDVTRRLTLGVLRYAKKARQESERILEKMNYEDYVVRNMSINSSDRPNVSAATIGGIMAICGFSDAAIENKLTLILTKMNKDSKERIEVPGVRIWNDLLATVVALPEHQDEEEMDMFAMQRRELNRVSLYDAIHDPMLRQYIGKKDFFQAFRIYDKRYMLLDRYYLREYLKREELSWVEFCTRIGRQFNCLSQEDARKIAYKNGDKKYHKPGKKILCFELPPDILEAWEDEEFGDDPDPTPPGSGIPGAPPSEPAQKAPPALQNGPGVRDVSGYKEPEHKGGRDEIDTGDPGGLDLRSTESGVPAEKQKPPDGGPLLRSDGSPIPPDGWPTGWPTPNSREAPPDQGAALVDRGRESGNPRSDE